MAFCVYMFYHNADEFRLVVKPLSHYGHGLEPEYDRQRSPRPLTDYGICRELYTGWYVRSQAETSTDSAQPQYSIAGQPMAVP